MTMTRKSLVAAALLVANSGSYASDCSPGSPMYEDAFFAICDTAREMQSDAADSETKPEVHGGMGQSDRVSRINDGAPLAQSLAPDRGVAD
jgi:hypothetical protein